MRGGSEIVVIRKNTCTVADYAEALPCTPITGFHDQFFPVAENRHAFPIVSFGDYWQTLGHPRFAGSRDTVVPNTLDGLRSHL